MKKIQTLLLSILITSNLQAQNSAKFDSSYIENATNKVSYEIPEVQELVHIIFCLTDFGQNSDEIINKETDYYQTVMDHFRPYETTKIVKKINKELKKNRYARLKMDAVGFYFDKNSIKKDIQYDQLNWDNKNWLEPYIEDLEVFAEITNFRAFFQEQQAVYTNEIEILKKQLVVKKHWEWLEKRFDNRYHSYRITFSPLVGGSHSTNHFEQDGFKQAIMFISSAYDPEKYNDRFSSKQLEGFMGRVVFTEIDHNYVNPLSNNFQQDIEVLFGEVSVWNNGKYGYNSPMSTFNEYMTHALYSLFVLDNYEEEDAALIIKKHEELMQRRGFIKYHSFNSLLMEIYKEDRSIDAKTLYKKLFTKMVKG